jgi:HK97 gp10 family phage protein
MAKMLPNGRAAGPSPSRVQSFGAPSGDHISIKLQGTRDVIEAFKDLREYLPKNPIRSAVRKGARRLEQLIVQLAPTLTGKLKRNISVRTRRTKETVRARVVINTKGDAKNPENAFYWRFLEEGFHTRSGDYKRLPFIITAFNQLKEQSAQEVVDSVDAALKRAERKAKRGASGGADQ